MVTNPFSFTQVHPFPSVGVIFVGSFGCIFGLCEHPLITYNKKILKESPGHAMSMEGKALNFDLMEAYKAVVENAN